MPTLRSTVWPTLEQRLDDLLTTRRFQLLLLSLFAGDIEVREPAAKHAFTMMQV